MKKVILAAILLSFSVFMYAQSTTSTSTSTSTSKAKSTDSAKPAAKTADAPKPAAKPAEVAKPAPAPAPAAKPVETPKVVAKPVEPVKTVTSTSTAKPGVKKDKDVFTMDVWCCPKHEKMESLKPGNCTYCHAKLEKETRSYTYKCKICGYTSDHEMNCPIDKNVKLKKFRVIYKCVPDNILSNSPGVCEKCGQPLKRIEIPPAAFGK